MRILFSVLLLFGYCASGWAEQDEQTAARIPPAAASKVPAPASKADKKQSVTFESLAQMNELIELGMPALALSLLDDEQKKRQQFTADWYAYEYKRILILSSLERWFRVIERTQWLFDTAVPDRHITARIRLWFETQQVIASLQLRQSEQALAQLQHLMWTTNIEDRDASLLVVWRRLVIRAYLQMELDDDARRALIKYERDYKSDEKDTDWVLLQAQVLLRTNRPQQAISLLQALSLEKAVDVEALLLIAQLQNEPKNAAKIQQRMREQLEGQVLSKPARWAMSYVAYLSSTVLSDAAEQVLYLESMLSLDIKYPVFDETYQVSADDLWDLYNKQGLIIANDNGLLFGNDKAWQELSNKLIKNEPEKALALNAALVLHTNDFATRQQQHKTIVEIIEKRKNGLELINQLYLHSSKVKEVNVLPEEVRYRLVDYALSESDYSEASKIMNSLDEPPQGKTLFDWRMRKARVLILGGKYKESENLIRNTFAEKKSITMDELDRYIQVVFDFQTVQQHQQALNLFELISLHGLSEKLKREIYFWKAESYYSLEKYDHAALFYLQSARAVSGEDNDLWAQSARFKAAGALVSAEIYVDAEKVYKDLLLITASETRKALINQNLQKIRLLKSAVKSNE
ncbi:MAG: hypothetical protein GQ549_03890 [Gammaproteobacteria bacterium]|nr:hypothetical protein [Gammaproteobacteria bacterium]